MIAITECSHKSTDLFEAKGSHKLTDLFEAKGSHKLTDLFEANSSKKWTSWNKMCVMAIIRYYLIVQTSTYVHLY